MSKSPRSRRAPREATPEYLRNAALYYLKRYATSGAHLRRLLLTKVARSARAHGTDPAAGAAEVAALIARLKAMGLLDDARFAEAKARSLHRAGASARAIRAALMAKGVAPGHIDAALDARAEDAAEPDLAAALAYARRRQLGPYRDAGARAEMRERDLAALGRRGFAYEIARRVVEADSAADLEAEAAGHATLS